LYSAAVGVEDTVVEREQLAGAFVVDPVGARADDRIFVLNIWGQLVDSVTYRNALAINGRSWPYTEPITATLGDSVRWRWINATHRAHPMHLHGFFFRVDAKGDAYADTAYAPDAHRLAVTEDMRPGQTMRMAWQPDRVGNWLFHCHIGFHVVPEARLDPPAEGAHEHHSSEATQHMAGLVLGIAVRAAPGWHEPARGRPRRLRLLVQEGRPHHRAPRAIGYVLQRGGEPARDSVEIPGSVLVTTRDQPTDITVVNRLGEATAVHWHGLELQSYWDGVAGWSGVGPRVAPAIQPGDSFTARLTLQRAGTFIYHTHLDDFEQLTSGLYGAIVVLEPGQRFDPATDHVFIVGWDGQADPPHLLVNGDSTPPRLLLAAGVAHRFRFVNIGIAGRYRFSLLRDSTLQTWRAVARDGANLPPLVAVQGPAALVLTVGQTADAVVVPAAGDYRLTMTLPDGTPIWSQTLLVRKQAAIARRIAARQER
jgi:FtsP/CotA-like multicopper oxidase with cupredoxin domain